ncbi:MAG: IGHMBP2 family helicase [Myxococcaceae bacterium]
MKTWANFWTRGLVNGLVTICMDSSHFEKLLRLLAQEREAERAQFAQTAAQLSDAEKAARGLVWLDAEAVETNVGLGGRFLVSLEQPKDTHRTDNPFRVGDILQAEPRRGDPVGGTTGVVSRSTRRSLQLAFDKRPPELVSLGRLKLYLQPNDVTFERAKAAVSTVLSWGKGQPRRRQELLLGHEPPQFGRGKPWEPARALNAEQQEAVDRSLAAEDLFLVHGPPGTGKSHVLAEIAVQAVREGKRVLCTAASNAAVDHLLDLCVRSDLSALRLGHPARVSPALLEHTLDVIVEEHPDRKLAREMFEEAFELLGYARRQRSQGRSRTRFANARESSAEAYKLMDSARALERKALASVLGRSKVICATLAYLANPLLANERFDLALVDEATQAIEPISLWAFIRAPKVILAGDHRQLPPTVLSPEAAKAGLATSLFERLLKEHGDSVKKMLREQYRMNERIMSFPSAQMYGGELRAHPSVASNVLEIEADVPPVLFLDTAGKGYDDELEPQGASHRNPGEAALIAARVEELRNEGVAAQDIGVIAPYSAQVALLRERLPDETLEVDTVDAFQGREKEAILLTLTRSNAEGQLGFLNDLRRINVALTRARRHLFVVGDSATLSSHPFYARFIEETQAQGGYRSAWEWPEPK